MSQSIESSLQPGRYIRAANGTIHPYNEFAINVATGITVFEVSSSTHVGSQHEADNNDVYAGDTMLSEHEKIDVIVSAVMSGNCKKTKNGNVDIKDLSHRLDFTVTGLLFAEASKQIAEMTADDS